MTNLSLSIILDLRRKTKGVRILQYPATIQRVISDVWVRSPQYLWQLHPELGWPFAESRGDIAYIIPEAVFSAAAAEFARSSGLKFGLIRNLEIWVLGSYGPFFYHDGFFRWGDYYLLWDAICEWYNIAYSFSPPLVPDSDENHDRIYHWAGIFITDAIDTALTISNDDQGEILKWFRFWMYCLSSPILSGGSYDRLLARYLRAKRSDYSLKLATHWRTHHEADFYVCLWGPEKWRFSPVATCGFRTLSDIAIIENLQGSPASPKLGKIPWKWLLVRAVEQLCRELELKAILFRPGTSQWYYREAWREANFTKRMDLTALELGYIPYFDPKDISVFYAKCLDGIERAPTDFLVWPRLEELLALKPDKHDLAHGF